jgi:hypothetical protein
LGTTTAPTSVPAANRTTSSYNASVVNFYNATGSLPFAFLKQQSLFHFEKCPSLLQRWRCGCNSKVVGLAPGDNPMIVSYNASAVKIYNAMNGLMHFESINIFFYYEKTLKSIPTLAL